MHATLNRLCLCSSYIQKWSKTMCDGGMYIQCMVWSEMRSQYAQMSTAVSSKRVTVTQEQPSWMPAPPPVLSATVGTVGCMLGLGVEEEVGRQPPDPSSLSPSPWPGREKQPCVHRAQCRISQHCIHFQEIHLYKPGSSWCRTELTSNCLITVIVHSYTITTQCTEPEDSVTVKLYTRKACWKMTSHHVTYTYMSHGCDVIIGV